MARGVLSRSARHPFFQNAVRLFHHHLEEELNLGGGVQELHQLPPHARGQNHIAGVTDARTHPAPPPPSWKSLLSARTDTAPQSTAPFCTHCGPSQYPPAQRRQSRPVAAPLLPPGPAIESHRAIGTSGLDDGCTHTALGFTCQREPKQAPPAAPTPGASPLASFRCWLGISRTRASAPSGLGCL